MVYERLGIKKYGMERKNTVLRKIRRKRRKIRQIYGNIADFSYDGNDPGNLYGKNLPCTGYGRKTGRDLCSVCSSWQRKLDMQKQKCVIS